jgi:beta-glucanase (GH16 family)
VSTVALSGVPTAQAQEAPACNFLQQLLNMCPKPTTTTTAPTTTTTAAPTTTTTAAPPTTCQPVPKAGGGTWQCVWADEFDGNELNRNYWSPQLTETSNLDSNDHDCWIDSPNNINVGNGVLTLTSRKEAAPFLCNDPSGARMTSQSSATIQTLNKVSVQRGRVEFRAKVTSRTPGTHSALWMWPQDLLGNEIDIAEMYGNWPDRAIPFLHYPLYFLDGQATNNYCMVADYSGWNRYTLEWTPQSLTVLYNDKVCIKSTFAASSYNEPYMLVISQMLGINEGNVFQSGVTPLPAHTIVDYVRVWQ